MSDIECTNKLCHYHKNNDICSYPYNGRSNPKLGEECFNFDYDCYICQGIGFKHFGCIDCNLTEDEYYNE